MKPFIKILHYIQGYWKDTILTWVFVLLESISEVLIAYLMQYLIDDVNSVQNEGTINNIYMFSGIIAAMAIFAAITGILAGYWAASASAGFGKNLRKVMYDHIQDYSFKNIDKFSPSSIVTRTTTDVANVQGAFLMMIRAVMRAPFMMIFAMIMCFVTEWKLAWIFLAIIPLVLFLLIYIAAKVHPIFVKIFTTYDTLNEEVEEDVDGIRVVKSFDKEDYQKEKFSKVSLFIYKHFIKAEKMLAFNGPIMNFAVYGAIILISYLGSKLIVYPNSDGTYDLTVGGFSTLITYVMMIMMSLMMVSMVYVMITIARNSVERIVEIVEEVPDIASPENPLKEVKNGDVEFKNVFFAYNEGKNVLKDINFHAASGSTVGIIGSTGSSKTTLVNLIARLYDVSEGCVMVGGEDVRKYNLVSLRDAVAVVLQKNTLFSGTIKDNLKWGNENATDEEIWKACDLAQATAFIKSFPQGLDTLLDQGGTNVSGGQKQRLCIARALLKNPKILILDDSTSACDTHTDALIREGLSNERTDITKFIISQRVLSIRNCQDILVMNEGEIVAHGNNDELMATCPVYKELYVSQLGGGDFDAKN
ncbi:MAG: ABC transporter ATP-binding protein/permease [Bacilli bacterium]|jgi:ATP-binding cassette subfamily B protein|nr:ABC transporter ATP-binding protein/permease [Bacilli bacterium]